MDEPQESTITIYQELDAACQEYDPRAAHVAARVAEMMRQPTSFAASVTFCARTPDCARLT